MTTTVLGQAPGAVDLTVYRGDTLILPITMQQGGVPLVLPTTGWLAQVRVSSDSAWTVLQFTVDASQAAVGELVLSLTASQTAAATDGFWDLQNTTGVPYTYLAGRFTVTKDVARV